MMKPHYVYAADPIEVIDGDTIDFRVDLGFGTFKNLRVRLLGVDTAEIYGVDTESQEHKVGSAQAEFVREWLKDKETIILRTYKDETGKYGRYLAEVYGDGKRLADALQEKWGSL